MKYIDSEKLIAEIDRLKRSIELNREHYNSTPLEFRNELDAYYAQELILNSLINTITSLQQEQPEVDLDAEIAIYLNRNVLNRINYSDIIENFTTIEAGELACYFYELGLNTRKEELDGRYMDGYINGQDDAARYFNSVKTKEE